MTTSSRQTNRNLERIIDQPLEGSKSANHDNSESNARPQASEANLAIDSADGLTSAFASLAVTVQFTDHDVGRVRDNSAADTSNVTTEEGNTGLSKSTIGFLGLAELLVDLRNGGLKGCEFDHGVRDLTSPKRVQTLVKTSIPFLRNNLAPAFTKIVCKRRQCSLHADLEGLEGAQEQIGNGLSSGRSTEVNDGFVGVGEQLLAIGVFEELVGAVLASSLERVSNESGGPAEEDTAESFFTEDCAPGLEIGLVKLAVYLATAFY